MMALLQEKMDRVRTLARTDSLITGPGIKALCALLEEIVATFEPVQAPVATPQPGACVTSNSAGVVVQTDEGRLFIGWALLREVNAHVARAWPEHSARSLLTR